MAKQNTQVRKLNGKRKHARLTYVDNGSDTGKIQKNYHTQLLYIHLQVTHTNGAAPDFTDGLYKAIRKLEITGDGNTLLRSIDGFKLKLDAMTGTGRSGKALETLTTTAATADLVSTVIIPVFFSMPNFVRPQDTILNPGLFSTMDISIDWAKSDALGTDITITDAIAEVYAVELWNHKRAANQPITHLVQSMGRKEVTSTAADFPLDLPDAKLYNSITLVAYVDGVRSDDVIKDVIIKSGESVFHNWPSEIIKAHMHFNAQVSNDEDLVGILHNNFADRGQISDSLDTRRGSPYNGIDVLLNVEKLGAKTEIVYYLDYIEMSAVRES